jgi:hypothetical protein
MFLFPIRFSHIPDKTCPVPISSFRRPKRPEKKRTQKKKDKKYAR